MGLCIGTCIQYPGCKPQKLNRGDEKWVRLYPLLVQEAGAMKGGLYRACLVD
jgi:hypothetical protein